MKIKNLKDGMSFVSIKAKIKEVTKPKVFKRMMGDSKLMVCSIEDETGVITLALWDDDCDDKKVGDSLSITGAKVKEFQGVLQLSVGRQGKIEVLK